MKKNILLNLNILSVCISIIFIILYGLPFYFVNKGNPDIFNSIYNIYSVSKNVYILTILFFTILFSGIILHELIHGLTWLFYVKNIKYIKFGFLLKTFTPYCHCSKPLKVKYYILGAIMPLIIMGIIPFLFSIFNANLLLLIFSLIFSISCSGDIYVVFKIMNEDLDKYVLDSPNDIGYDIMK